jgi:hypothetical protein
VNPDGSGTVETTMTLSNTLPEDVLGKRNEEANLYTVFYGPGGATVDRSSDEPDIEFEEPVSDHPGVGYAVTAPPLGSDSVKIVWQVPELLTRDDDGTWRYSLFWQHVATNRADTLHLQVELPNGWKWAKDPPPSDVRLDRDLHGAWALQDRG